MPDLEGVARRQRGAADALAIQVGAICRSLILHEETAAVALDAGMRRGDPRIVEVDAQPGAGARCPSRPAAADVDGGHALEIVPRRLLEERIAAQGPDQIASLGGQMRRATGIRRSRAL